MNILVTRKWEQGNENSFWACNWNERAKKNPTKYECGEKNQMIKNTRYTHREKWQNIEIKKWGHTVFCWAHASQPPLRSARIEYERYKYNRNRCHSPHSSRILCMCTLKVNSVHTLMMQFLSKLNDAHCLRNVSECAFEWNTCRWSRPTNVFAFVACAEHSHSISRSIEPSWANSFKNQNGKRFMLV